MLNLPGGFYASFLRVNAEGECTTNNFVIANEERVKQPLSQCITANECGEVAALRSQ